VGVVALLGRRCKTFATGIVYKSVELPLAMPLREVIDVCEPWRNLPRPSRDRESLQAVSAELDMEPESKKG
jgi:hypothetical protein